MSLLTTHSSMFIPYLIPILSDTQCFQVPRLHVVLLANRVPLHRSPPMLLSCSFSHFAKQLSLEPGLPGFWPHWCPLSYRFGLTSHWQQLTSNMHSVTLTLYPWVPCSLKMSKGAHHEAGVRGLWVSGVDVSMDGANQWGKESEWVITSLRQSLGGQLILDHPWKTWVGVSCNFP